MTVYIAYLVAILIEAWLIKPQKSDKKKFAFLCVAFLELVAFTGLRAYNIGSDTETYLRYIDKYRGVSFREIFDFSNAEFERGYTVFMRICSYFNFTKTEFLFLISIVTYFPFFVFIYRYSDYPEVSVFVYFATSLFFYSLGIFRQMIAISICLTGVPFITERKPLRFFIVIFIAYLFHKTALIWLLLYFLYPLKGAKPVKFFAIVALIILPFGRPLAILATKFLPEYEHYLNSKYDPNDGSYIGIAFYYIILLMYFALNYFNRKLSKIERLSVTAFCITLVLQATAYSFDILGRMIVYFSVFLTILVPSFLKRCCSKSERRWVMPLLIVCLTALALLQLYTGDTSYPFLFYWQYTPGAEAVL